MNTAEYLVKKLEELGVNDFFGDEKVRKDVKSSVQKNESENNLIDKLGMIPVSETVLAQIVKMSISEIKSMLVVLELQGLVRKVDGGYVRV